MNNNEKEFIKTLQDLTQKLDENGGERKFIIDYIKKYFQISVSFIPLGNRERTLLISIGR